MFDEIDIIAFNIKQLDDFDLAYHSDYMGTEGLWGFKNEKGEVVCSPKFLFEPICCGKNYIVCVGTGWEHYDELPDGKIWSKEMHWGLINSKFEAIIPLEYDEVECLSNQEYNDNDVIIPNDIDYFVCRKYLNNNENFHVEVEVRDSKNNLIISGYSDVDYMIFYNQLVIYKNRDRWGNFDDSGYSGVYDLLLDKEIIAPNKYYEIEIVDHNLFIVSNDVENALYGTLINKL